MMTKMIDNMKPARKEKIFTATENFISNTTY